MQLIVDRTLATASAASFAHVTERGERLTMLRLTDAQRLAAEQTFARLRQWTAAVEAFLRRRGDDTAEIEQLEEEMKPCVTLRWKDRDDVHERAWRTKFHRELLRVSLQLTAQLPAIEQMPREQETSSAPPLRLLVMVSAPPGVIMLDGESERSLLEAALSPLTMLGLFHVDVVGGSSFDSLRRKLRSARERGCPYDIFHYIGHGETEALLMTDDAGQPRDATPADLEALFAKETSLRLVVLNACDGVRFDANGSPAGVAAAFLKCGVAAVIAMQAPISDSAAILFTEELYGALSVGASIDAAVSEARQAIFFQTGSRESQTPVLLRGGG
jgi:hypothetical protein